MYKSLQFLIFSAVFTILFIILLGRFPFSIVHANSWQTIERINISSPGEVPFSKITSNGGYLVFNSINSNLVQGDANNFCDTDGNGVENDSCEDIFLYDHETKNITLVSTSSGGMQGNQRSSFPSISPNARHIAFSSQASNLVPDGLHNCLYFKVFMRQCTDIFVHDRDLGITERVNVASDGTKTNGNSNFPSISANGRYITFSSEANNLVPNDIQICPDIIKSTQCTHIFVHDRLTSTTERVDLSSNGEKGNSGSYRPNISGDGHHIAFLSSSKNLVPNDNNAKSDIFVRAW